MTAPAPPLEAAELFGEQLEAAERFAAFLATAGVERGVIGPREVPVLWVRHLLNCAHVGSLVPPDLRVVDVGSGAGLPGVVLAVARPDLRVDLVEPLVRRCAFLEEAVGLLRLDGRVRVVRGRAEERAVRSSVGGADVVTARAVAPLDRLVRWCLPLVSPGGLFLAMKGERAQSEVEAAAGVIRSLGGTGVAVELVGSGQSATRVVRMTRTKTIKR